MTKAYGTGGRGPTWRPIWEHSPTRRAVWAQYQQAIRETWYAGALTKPRRCMPLRLPMGAFIISASASRARHKTHRGPVCVTCAKKGHIKMGSRVTHALIVRLAHRRQPSVRTTSHSVSATQATRVLTAEQNVPCARMGHTSLRLVWAPVSRACLQRTNLPSLQAPTAPPVFVTQGSMAS